MQGLPAVVGEFAEAAQRGGDEPDGVEEDGHPPARRHRCDSLTDEPKTSGARKQFPAS
jgi:hypothetical protein